MEGGHSVGPRQDLVLVDTNVFVIDLRYKRDAYYELNRAFLDHMAEQKNGFTTIVNLLELCGILSFNLNENQLVELWSYFQDRYAVVVLLSLDCDLAIFTLPALIIKTIPTMIARSMIPAIAVPLIEMSAMRAPRLTARSAWKACRTPQL